MSKPKGMVSGEPIELSGGQQKQHFIPGQIVSGVVLKEKGDGWIENAWHNRHLSGAITLLREEEGVYSHDFVPVDNVVIQVDKVYDQMAAEIERIAGWHDDLGLEHAGELELLQRSRGLLFDWVTLTPDDKADIASFFSDVADVRARAINPFNLVVGSVANRARELKDRTGRMNPGAILAMTLKLEKNLKARHGQVARNININNKRGNRLQHEWLFNENHYLTECHTIMKNLLKDQSQPNPFSLRLMAPHVRFRVRPFNLMAHELAQTNGEIAEDQVVLNSLAALQFERYKNYLLSPFRRVTADPNRKRTKKSLAEEEEQPIPEALQQRMIALYSMDAPGATGRLVKRLIPLGEQVIQATHSGDTHRARQIGTVFKWLVNYHCLPQGDPEMQVWHQYQLR